MLGLEAFGGLWFKVASSARGIGERLPTLSLRLAPRPGVYGLAPLMG